MKHQGYDYRAVGARVKAARRAKGYTQEYVAEKTDMDCQNISNIERGVCGLSVGTLIELCRTLETSADYILFGQSGGGPLERLYADMDEKQRKFVEELILLYAESRR